MFVINLFTRSLFQPKFNLKPRPLKHLLDVKIITNIFNSNSNLSFSSNSCLSTNLSPFIKFVPGLSDFVAIPSLALSPVLTALRKAVNNSHVFAAVDLHLTPPVEGRHKKAL